MKRIILAASAVFMASLLPSCGNHPDGISGATKDYDSNGNKTSTTGQPKPSRNLRLTGRGRVRKPEINLKHYFKREVVYKQAVLNDSGQVAFTGAYRYRGYSLFDLLNPFVLGEKTLNLFRQPMFTSLLKTNSGDRVVFSWAEIFLGHNMHQVLIATEQADVEPYKVKVEYPKDSVWKVVATKQLVLTCRVEKSFKNNCGDVRREVLHEINRR